MKEQAMHAPHDVERGHDEQAVIVEITQDGAARIGQCPPGVVVMIVESAERSEQELSPTSSNHLPHQKRSIGAGKRRGLPGTAAHREEEDIEVYAVPVKFPG